MNENDDYAAQVPADIELNNYEQVDEVKIEEEYRGKDIDAFKKMMINRKKMREE